MNLKNSNSKKLYVLLMIFALSLAAVLCSTHKLSTSASYGYREGDVYTFTEVGSITAKTEEGESSLSSSFTFSIKLKNIERSTGGYNVSVEELIISATSMEGSDMSYKRTVEGDPVPFTGGTYGVSGSPNLLVSTDWDKRGDEWKALVESEGKSNDGWSVKDRSSSNGAFTAIFDFDVTSAQSHTDFDGDGKTDSYTGSRTDNIAYDSNGVLSSYSTQVTKKFDSQNSVTTSMTMARGSPGLDLMTVLTYVAIGVVSFIVAFVIGFFIGNSRKPKTAAIYPPETNASAPPPPPR